MVEGGAQLDAFRQQHAVAEHVARHVADADDREGLGLGVAPHFPEMAFHRFPRAARGDAHLLVVVADRAARRECVAKPEIVVSGESVGDVREGRCALVGGDDEIGVVTIPRHDARRMHGLAVNDVVGELEKRADEHFICRDPGGLDFLARAFCGQGLRIEAALRAHRHDDGVLHLLRLHETEHFGAEIIAPVGPAQAAACDGTEAQVDAFDIRRPDEDFAEGPRRGQRVRLAAGDLHGDVPMGFARRVGEIEVGALEGFHQRQKPAQGAVCIQRGDGFDLLFDLGDNWRGRCRAGGEVAFGCWVELDCEQLQQVVGDVRMFGEGADLNQFGGIKARLAAIAAEGTEQGRGAPVNAKRHHQAVEAVILGVARPDRLEGFLEACVESLLARRAVDSEVVDVDRAAGIVFVLGNSDRIADLGLHAQAHAFEHGHDLGKIERAVAMVDFHAADIGLEVGAPDAGAQRLAGSE